ncbi:hypothetical protein [Synechococcus sp. A15-60]|uniref:hypothetical protein n=1 Tax=Synechococcus sp. A15-60 TaxID=1050655 RepID=UPI001646DA40|nr:hypothetical protein [Synechococcus sp. A15-60]
MVGSHVAPNGMQTPIFRSCRTATRDDTASTNTHHLSDQNQINPAAMNSTLTALQLLHAQRSFKENAGQRKEQS